jgi:hypothetical protein
LHNQSTNNQDLSEAKKQPADESVHVVSAAFVVPRDLSGRQVLSQRQHVVATATWRKKVERFDFVVVREEGDGDGTEEYAQVQLLFKLKRQISRKRDRDGPYGPQLFTFDECALVRWFETHPTPDALSGLGCRRLRWLHRTPYSVVPLESVLRLAMLMPNGPAAWHVNDFHKRYIFARDHHLVAEYDEGGDE